MISSHFLSEGISRLDIVHTGEEAIQAIKTLKPDLVVSAMYLPDYTAIDLIKDIRSSDTFSDTPFMLISSEQKASYIEPLRESGVVAILPKPFDQTDLKRALLNTTKLIDPEPIQLEMRDIGDISILIVDDSMSARNYITSVLNKLGVRHITQASNGILAKALISAHQFDLVLTDVNMPEMDGEALVNYIKEESEQPSLPIVVVTSHMNSTRIKSIRQAGVFAIVDKPFDIEQLRQLIFALLEE